MFDVVVINNIFALENESLVIDSDPEKIQDIYRANILMPTLTYEIDRHI